MGSIINGLAVILIILEGIMIKCEGAPNRTQPRWVEDLQISHTEETQQMDIIDETTIGSIGQWKNPIVLMIPRGSDNDESYQYHENDDLFLVFGNYAKLKSFLEISSDRVKRIAISNKGTSTDMLSEAISIMRKYLKNLDEIRIATHDRRVWDLLSIDRIFRTVKKFEYFACAHGFLIGYKLNLLFPELESLKLLGTLSMDLSCLKDVTTLKDLELVSGSVRKERLKSIIAKNTNMRTIFLSQLNATEAMGSVPENLDELKTLYVLKPDGHFFFKINNHTLYAPLLDDDFYLHYIPPKPWAEVLHWPIPPIPPPEFFIELQGRLLDTRYSFTGNIIDMIGNIEELRNFGLIIRIYTPAEIEDIKKMFREQVWTISSERGTRFRNQLVMFERERFIRGLCNIV